MDIATFWKIILKGIGLWFLINAVYIISQLGSTIYFIDNQDVWYNFLVMFLINVFLFFFYLLIVRTFLFNSEWLMRILKLEQNFSQNKIDINMNYETILHIVVIISGALVFVEAFPNLIRELYQFIQQKEIIKDYRETSWIIFYLLKSLLGYLLMTNSQIVKRFINKEIKKN